ncbi:hypothetical protein [Actinacidiphila paucisporea]|uniref:hypothetical protein n=1 Tax=Actinacidiphila paucisporea TaxID=310782 RepID=UPI00190E6FF1|nr:hypothetical protein [Actinacidiphila paucisporea]
MPWSAGGNGWTNSELAHTVLAGKGGGVYAAGEGRILPDGAVVIAHQSGHFTPDVSTLQIAKTAFKRAGIDVSLVEDLDEWEIFYG